VVGAALLLVKTKVKGEKMKRIVWEALFVIACIVLIVIAFVK
jgi:hypothetical protein